MHPTYRAPSRSRNREIHRRRCTWMQGGAVNGIKTEPPNGTPQTALLELKVQTSRPGPERHTQHTLNLSRSPKRKTDSGHVLACTNLMPGLLRGLQLRDVKVRWVEEDFI